MLHVKFLLNISIWQFEVNKYAKCEETKIAYFFKLVTRYFFFGALQNLPE